MERERVERADTRRRKSHGGGGAWLRLVAARWSTGDNLHGIGDLAFVRSSKGHTQTWEGAHQWEIGVNGGGSVPRRGRTQGRGKSVPPARNCRCVVLLGSGGERSRRRAASTAREAEQGVQRGSAR
ncbi:hypothetical protein E2562_017048 [Oryza meyeriana var. granulata]|uniref:Uncharacterized protein n=1 Tax=Oryza meyeriana var. granulata TaxID=110450 RepID=A0A6G1F8K0_9ORYZ|nr:hypothetical protein E2562_017048 [Oryza meyeriana var. granulata]